MIIPSILESDFEEVKNKIKIVERFTDFASIDVIDGILLKNQTFGDVEQLESLGSNVIFELDLMVENPENFVSRKYSNVSRLCLNSLSSLVSKSTINRYKSLEYEVGISIHPSNLYEEYERYVDIVDYVQFYTVVPGGQGRAFVPEVLDSITKFKIQYPSKRVQVDGGINQATIDLVVSAGVQDMAVGSAIFSSPDPMLMFNNLSERI